MTDVQQKQENPLHTVRQGRYQGQDIYVYANSFNAADAWFAKCLRTGNTDFKNMENEIKDENTVYVDKIVDIQSDEPILYAGDKEPLADKLTKGYDFESGCYVFSVVDTYTREANVEAATAEEAIEKAEEGKVNFPNEWTVERNIYACSENDRIVIEGKVVRYCSENELEDRIRQEFPDGLVVTLENESLSHLLECRQVEEDGEWMALNGMLSDKGIMAGAYGNLEARLILKPDDYDMLDACEDTYYSGVLSDMGWDAEANSTSMLLATEESMHNVRVQVGVSEAALNCLLIEGRPYREVMELVDRYHIKDEKVLVHHLHTDFLDQQPEWKRKMAEQETKGAVNEFYVNKVAPAWNNLKRMFHETQEQAAQENGYASAAEWNRDVQWTRNPSPELADRLRKTSERWKELYTPFENEFNKVGEQMEQLKASEQRAFINRFNRQAEKVISQVNVIQRGPGYFAVRCKIDGVQQMGKNLSQEHVRTVMDAPDKNMKEMAACYYKDEIIASMQQSRQQGLKR